MMPAHLLDVERLPYGQGIELMRALAEQKALAMLPEILILAEHEPVVTLGRRSRGEDLLVPRQTLEERGIGLYPVERGGLITYHGPGQLVAYPVFDLKRLKLGVARFVNRLEEVVLATLRDFDLTAASRRAGFPGVWIGEEKIASIGLAVRRGISFHGLALNVDLDMTPFDLFHPCGLAGVRMTSMARALGSTVDKTCLKLHFINHCLHFFSLKFTPWTLAEAWETARAHAAKNAETAVA